ncbi:MAG: tetratricopeptide repeat protein [Bacteroidetes bacterium]|nr:tetratricopeptide repeat protein [Bacteroidota bacterium]
MDTKKILWVRLDAIGDAILSASMLPHIYDRYDQAQITVVCTDNTAELYEACPFVETVIGVEKMKLFIDSGYRNQIVLGLREKGFDVAFDTTCSLADMGDLFLVGSQARERFAFENRGAIPEERLVKRRKVYTRLIAFEREYEPELDRYRDFLREIGADVPELKPTVWTTKEDDEYADRMFASHELDPERTLALFAFGRSHLRTYPYYGEALSDVCRENNLSVVALGDGSAFGFNESCLNEINAPTVNLSGKTTLRQSAAILKKCRMAVGAETGLGHLACAVGVPNVIVIGGGHAGRFMPYSPTTSLVTLPLECFDCDWTCKFKKAHCVMDLAPEVIEYAVKETLRTKSDKPRMFLHPQSRWAQGKNMPAWKMAGKFLKPEKLEVIQVGFETKSQKERVSLRSFKPQEKPAAVAAALEEAKAMRDAGRFDESLSVLERAIDENAHFPDLMVLKAELYVQAGRIEEAKEILWSTILKFPFDVQALNNIIVVEILQRRYESALGLLRRVLDIDPDNGVALSNLRFIENGLLVRSKLISAEQSIMKGEFKLARKSLNEIFETYPDNEDALTDLAIVEAQEGNNGEALKILQMVMAENPASEFAAQLMEKMLLK